MFPRRGRRLGAPSNPESPAQSRLVQALTAVIVLDTALLVVFVLPADLLFGSPGSDLGQQFLAWRAFAAASLKAGHLPLWNPYSYSGEPFLGGFQSAVFYPPNLIFLALPLARAVNLSIIAHLLILGWGMWRWARQRGLRPAAAGLAAIVTPLCGTVWPHIYAGHISNLCTLAWMPWIFAGMEDWYRGRKFSGLLSAAAAVAFQVLAGHVQYAYDTAVAVGLHAIVSSVVEPASRKRALPAVAGVYLAAAALAAAQIAPGWAAAAEGVRQSRLSFDFAGQFSLPPENLLTGFAPGFFGDLSRHIYWGREQLWEMSLFAGVSGLLLAAVALIEPVSRRYARRDLGIAAVLLVLALGVYTPLFRILYDFLPGFSRFRGSSKFSCPAMMFFVMAIGQGADVLIRGGVRLRACCLTTLIAALAAGATGAFLLSRPSAIAVFLLQVRDSGGTDLPPDVFTDPAFVRAAGDQAGRSLAIAGAVCLILGSALALASRRPILRWAPLCLLPLEMITFAWTHFTTLRKEQTMRPGLRAIVAAHPGDYRVLEGTDNGFLTGAPDLLGNDPGVLKRYAEFIEFSQGRDPDKAGQLTEIRSLSPLYAMLRLRYVQSNPERGARIYEARSPMDRVQLISHYQVIPGRDSLFSALRAPGFDPRRTTLLETEPDPRPDTDALYPGSARVVDSSSDWLTVEADLAHPALLLITDLYSRDWRVSALENGGQAVYRIQPANYILRAIPLAAGHHRLRIEYVPTGLGAGALVSVSAWLLWLAAVTKTSRRA